MTLTKDIEVELRGYLKQDTYKDLKTFLTENGEFTGIKNRIIIDFSTCLVGGGVRERTLDVRARITNGVGEVIKKKVIGAVTKRVKKYQSRFNLVNSPILYMPTLHLGLIMVF